MTSAAFRAAGVALALAAVAAPGIATADPPAPEDRAAVEACLKLVAERRAALAKQPAGPEEVPGPAGRLAGAAEDAKSDPESCIGVVTIACQRQPGGGSTMGERNCNERELGVWDERLNRRYSVALREGGKVADAVRRVERAWLAWRDARCALPAVEEEGGSIVGPLTSACLMDATARQAIWLENR